MTITIDGTVGANKAVVLDSAGKLPAIDGSLLTTLNATQVTTGSIATARIDTGTTTGKVLVLDGSGNMPAIAAGVMTGVSSATQSASDPAIDTNPATGLGTKWINTTSGEMFVCTDATAGANVWTNVGAGTGDIQPWSFQGLTKYYHCGGDIGGTSGTNKIEKDVFASDGNLTDTANLVTSGEGAAGAPGETHGYSMGRSTNPSTGVTTDATEKFNFSTEADGVAVGVLTTSRAGVAGASSGTYAYASAGWTYGGPGNSTTIDKLSMASDGDSTSVGALTVAGTWQSGTSSSTYGYVNGGGNRGNVIDKFSFSSDGNATDVGNLTTSRTFVGGCSSSTHGYGFGGSNVIEKYSHSSDGDATDVGNLTYSRRGHGGASSETYGYCPSGYAGYTSATDKFSFTSDGDAVSTGNLSQGVTGSHSYHV
ncbi:MAG: hypothetical protein QGH83_15565 [Candidatus Pacebacteria bacterium]|nr:hypothetical protein [Candidatus Paceibacterota bacterium]